MKKSFLMLGLAVAAMTSCTNDEVMEVNQNNLIKFESFVNKGTRAVTPVTTADLKKFYIFGGYDASTFTNVFNHDSLNVSATIETNKEWTYNDYQFAAYANENNSTAKLEGVSFNSNGLKFENYVVKDGNDLVAALASRNNKTEAFS